MSNSIRFTADYNSTSIDGFCNNYMGNPLETDDINDLKFVSLNGRAYCLLKTLEHLIISPLYIIKLALDVGHCTVDIFINILSLPFNPEKASSNLPNLCKKFVFSIFLTTILFPSFFIADAVKLSAGAIIAPSLAINHVPYKPSEKK